MEAFGLHLPNALSPVALAADHTGLGQRTQVFRDRLARDARAALASLVAEVARERELAAVI